MVIISSLEKKKKKLVEYFQSHWLNLFNHNTNERLMRVINWMYCLIPHVREWIKGEVKLG